MATTIPVPASERSHEHPAEQYRQDTCVLLAPVDAGHGSESEARRSSEIEMARVREQLARVQDETKKSLAQMNHRLAAATDKAQTAVALKNAAELEIARIRAETEQKLARMEEQLAAGPPAAGRGGQAAGDRARDCSTPRGDVSTSAPERRSGCHDRSRLHHCSLAAAGRRCAASRDTAQETDDPVGEDEENNEEDNEEDNHVGSAHEDRRQEAAYGDRLQEAFEGGFNGVNKDGPGSFETFISHGRQEICGRCPEESLHHSLTGRPDGATARRSRARTPSGPRFAGRSILPLPWPARCPSRPP